MSIFGSLQQGAAAQAAGEYQNVMDQRQGIQDVASSQRQMIEQQQKNDMVMGRQIALAAASGGGVQNPTIASIYGQTAGKGDYMARVPLSQGQQRQWALDVEGQNAQWKGDVANDAAQLSAIGSGLTGLSKVNWNSFGSLPDVFG
jgi:hypothetical protein